MNDNKAQDITHATYEDSTFVDKYVQRQAIIPKSKKIIIDFSKYISGKKVLDLGCGPGQDSYVFAELGYEVTGLDFSSEMIERAKTLRESTNKPKFMVGDMRLLPEYFEENSFDAIWASASLLHIRPEDIFTVLDGMNTIAKSGSKIYIRLKGGENKTILAEEHKYDVKSLREFTLWTKDSFIEQTSQFNWTLDAYKTREPSEGLKFSHWMMFFFTVK